MNKSGLAVLAAVCITSVAAGNDGITVDCASEIRGKKLYVPRHARVEMQDAQGIRLLVFVHGPVPVDLSPFLRERRVSAKELRVLSCTIKSAQP